MARATGKRRKKVITLPLTPPANADHVGTVRWGKEQKHVYRERRPDAHISKVVPVTEADGTKRWKEDQHGRRTQRYHTKRVWLYPEDPANADYLTGRPDPEDERNYREFILDDLGNGNDSKVFNFRADPEVEARKRAERERKAKWDKLMDTLDPDKLLDALAKAEAEPDEEPEPVTVERADNGWWEIRRGDEVLEKGRGQTDLDDALARIGEPQAA